MKKDNRYKNIDYYLENNVKSIHNSTHVQPDTTDTANGPNQASEYFNNLREEEMKKF